MKPIRCVVNMPPSFVVITDAEGPRWLNTKNILSVRELDGGGTLIELDNGDVAKVKERAFDIGEYLQRPAITISVEDEGAPSEDEFMDADEDEK
jgi:hypothetical protein